MPTPKSPTAPWTTPHPVPLTIQTADWVTTTPTMATSASDLGGGSGTWANPTNATGGDDGAHATWTVP